MVYCINMTGVLKTVCRLKLYIAHDVSEDVYLIRQLEREKGKLIWWGVLERLSIAGHQRFPLSTFCLRRETDPISETLWLFLAWDGGQCTVVILTCFVMCVCVYVWVL
jgi:hypothetical protein